MRKSAGAGFIPAAPARRLTAGRQSIWQPAAPTYRCL